VTTGLPGDFGVTLYFGHDQRVRKHFAAAVSVTHDILEYISPTGRSRQLFRYPQELFHRIGMRSNVASVTDSVLVDLGHSLPRISKNEIDQGRQLTSAAKAAIQNERLFISESADWPLTHAGQFTIEPSLVSLTDPSSPQVSPHYVLAVTENSVTICDEGDILLREFGLIP
jgi:hypothetical protein